MTKEQDLYDKFVNVLNKKLDSTECSPKDLEIIQKFIAQQGLQASDSRNKGLQNLTKKTMELPFEDEDEAPLKRVK